MGCAKTLTSGEALLKNYYAVGHDSLDNYIAQVTGQSPDPATMNDCGVETLFSPTNVVEKPYHQLVGDGCIYPASVPTLGNQISAAQLTWKAYLQDMGNDPARDNTTQTSPAPSAAAAAGRDDLRGELRDPGRLPGPAVSRCKLCALDGHEAE